VSPFRCHSSRGPEFTAGILLWHAHTCQADNSRGAGLSSETVASAATRVYGVAALAPTAIVALSLVLPKCHRMSMDNWHADEILAHEQLREARAEGKDP
jgi:hypothetical protein